MAYTKIAKPTASSYTNVNAAGKEQYNQTSLTYDNSGTYYDGVNMNQYTKLTKPTTSYTKIAKPT